MALTSRSAILDLNKVCGGQPAVGVITAKGKSRLNMHNVYAGQIITARGLGFEGNVNVNGTWKPFTNGYINVNGTWKELDQLKNNISDAWKN
tara:strand:+ start:257 stop:532 length:276 start_codon:yes stop_codon:yes gene_type:complete